ncbi:aldo/keto reductase [Stenotrophomonas sp.]|uniref:aldo/keto reductase n=1 Tax=Stenotrophomonas sp. TaxID=69392 RepID=UPI0028A0DF82|nr:aldo/keto reductase [Stenotrophomonas sp.]
MAATFPLPRRPLGRSGLQVSQIALGCSGFWGNRRFAEAEAERIVRRALERGVNLFDTGHNYSAFNAEPRLGRILQRAFASHPRDGLVISSKGGTLTGQAGVSGAEQRDFSPEAIERSCAASLRNLQCDHLDIFQLHGIGLEQINDELLGALARMRRNGMFRLLGINTHTGATMQHLVDHPTLFDVALIDYNALQQDREPLITAMHDAGIGVLAGTVLAQGHLLPARPRVPRLADAWYLARAWLKPSSRQLMRSARGMQRAVAAVHSQTPAQTAFAYVLQHPGIASGVLGTTRVRNLEQILDTRVDALQPDERARLVAAFLRGGRSPSQ